MNAFFGRTGKLSTHRNIGQPAAGLRDFSAERPAVSSFSPVDPSLGPRFPGEPAELSANDCCQLCGSRHDSATVWFANRVRNRPAVKGGVWDRFASANRPQSLAMPFCAACDVAGPFW